MKIYLTYFKLELKRALKRFPFLMIYTAVLILFLGAAALLAGRTLYDGHVSGRIRVGVVLPEGDAAAKQVISMISSLESVKSICDFSYMDQEECERQLKAGTLYAILSVPQDFVQDIMTGINTPISIWLPKSSGIESRIFKELADAGAATLSASQAGIYAGDELLSLWGLSDSIPQLEQDLNSIYLSYSLPRADYFRHISVSATNDTDPVTFYGISLFVLMTLLSSIPVSGYLTPHTRVMGQKLRLLGIGPAAVILCRIFSLAVLLGIVSLPCLFISIRAGIIKSELLTLAAFLLFCLSASSFTVFFYQAAGSLIGGVIFLFLGTVIFHFLSGGFLPLVFLPSALQPLALLWPSRLLMDTIEMMVTGHWELIAFARLGAAALVSLLLCIGIEEKRE